MSSIDKLFAELRTAGRRAFMPFITAGDPDLEFTAAVLAELASRGSHLIELGIPYSDPIADGPVIQASYTRALEKKIKLAEIFGMLKQVTPTIPAPVVTMASYAIIYRREPERYLDAAQAAGVAGAIVPDLPVDESEKLSALCRARDFSLIQLVTPTTPRDRALRIAATSTGFLYYVSVTGITGERTELPPELVDNVGWLRSQTQLPICIGFGISRPEHVTLLKEVADGLIVGSAVVRAMADPKASREQRLRNVGNLASTLLAALAGEPLPVFETPEPMKASGKAGAKPPKPAAKPLDDEDLLSGDDNDDDEDAAPKGPVTYADDTLAKALARHDLSFPPEQVEQLDRYAKILWEWNAKINLTRHTDYERFVSRDVVDSVMFSKQLQEGQHIADVGTGGGVPGIILAIIRPDIHVTMIESVAKKARVVEDMVRELGLVAPVFHDRIEKHLEDNAYDTLVVRAVAPMVKLLDWLKGRWGSFRRLLVVKGPAWKEECAKAKDEGLTNRIDIRRVATYPLPGTESDSVILEILTKGRHGT